MTTPAIFAFDSHAVRVQQDANGDPWFVATDVAAVLGYRNAPDMVRNLDDDEKGTHNLRTPGGDQEVSTINESGLYSAIFRSRKAEAKRFKKWVTAEVLPAIRKTGVYGGLPSIEASQAQYAKSEAIAAAAKASIQAARMLGATAKAMREGGMPKQQALAYAAEQVLATTGINLLEGYQPPRKTITIQGLFEKACRSKHTAYPSRPDYTRRSHLIMISKLRAQEFSTIVDQALEAGVIEIVSQKPVAYRLVAA